MLQAFSGGADFPYPLCGFPYGNFWLSLNISADTKFAQISFGYVVFLPELCSKTNTLKLMKRTILLLLLIAAAAHVKAQSMYDDEDNVVKLGWNTSGSLGVGYAYLHSPLKGDEYCDIMPTHMLQVNAQILAVYLGFDYASRDTYKGGHGYKENVSTIVAKIGPSFRYGKWGNNISLTPYAGILRCDVSIKVGNEEFDAPHGHRGHDFVYGVRLAYTTKFLELSLNYSNHEVGFGVAAKVDFGGD